MWNFSAKRLLGHLCKSTKCATSHQSPLLPANNSYCLSRMNTIKIPVYSGISDCQIRLTNQFTNMQSCGFIQTLHFHSTTKMEYVENNKTKALTILKDIKELKHSPYPALTLGLAGLIPFAAVPCYMIGSGGFLPELAFVQAAYGAAILSFLGGVRWGFTLPEDNPVRPDWTNLGYSVLPSLIAWGALLLPTSSSLLTLIGGLGFVAYFDMAMYGYPPWFKGLRFLLTFVAVISLWSTFLCGFVLSNKTHTKGNDKGASSSDQTELDK